MAGLGADLDVGCCCFQGFCFSSVIGTVEAGREANPLFSASWILDVDSGSPTLYRFLSRVVCVDMSPGLFGVLGYEVLQGVGLSFKTTLGVFEANSRDGAFYDCLLYTSPSPRDLSTSRMPSSA